MKIIKLLLFFLIFLYLIIGYGDSSYLIVCCFLSITALFFIVFYIRRKKLTKIQVRKLFLIFSISIILLGIFLGFYFRNDIRENLFPIHPEMIFVEGGTFQMGDTFGDGDTNEKPVHTVEVDSFYIGKYEVTQGEWVAIMGTNHSHFKGRYRPVERVNWNATIRFCNKKSIKENLTPCYIIDETIVDGSLESFIIICDWSANGYRLPTEAEWEYAARGGNNSKGYKYSGSNNISDVACVSKKKHPSGSKKPNEIGVYDMTGHVYEWCWDLACYDSSYYKNSPKKNPRGPEIKKRSNMYNRVFRGGCRWISARYCTTSSRRMDFDRYYSPQIGFRIARSFVKE